MNLLLLYLNLILYFITTYSILLDYNDTIPNNIDIYQNNITISGISAGAYMAVQLHIIYSKTFSGINIIAGGPFWCAKGEIQTAINECMNNGDNIDIDYLIYITKNTQNYNYIDNVNNIIDNKVWIMSAINDTVVNKSVVIKLQEYYQYFKADIKTVFDIQGEHGQITDNYGSDCFYLGNPYILNCNYNSVEHGLNWVYQKQKKINNNKLFIKKFSKNKFNNNDNNNLNDNNNNNNNYLNYENGRLIKFKQELFLSTIWNQEYGLNKYGYIYIPNYCYQNKCSLHIALHGCLMTLEDINTQFIEHSGYIEYANLYHIVILFPQAQKNRLNPKGCFDWWGYTGKDYASNIGIQPSFIKNIVDNLIK